MKKTFLRIRQPESKGPEQVVFEPGERVTRRRRRGWMGSKCGVETRWVGAQVKLWPGDGKWQVSAICRTTSSVAHCPPIGLLQE